KSLLASSVPDLELDLIVIHINRLYHEVHSYCGALAGRKDSLNKFADKTCLPDSRIPHQYHFEEILVVLHKDWECRKERYCFFPE
ncbi:hypothetical protein PENTCL1PPCAC_11766, partial [Pristionchus entomophagus]